MTTRDAILLPIAAVVWLDNLVVFILRALGQM